jgi:hypothetical protein
MRKKDEFEIIENEIHKFKSKINTKYKQEVYVIIRNYIHLDSLYDCVLMSCNENDNQIYDILKDKGISSRTTLVCNYIHSFYHIANKLGFPKLRIAKFMGKNHATIINGIKKAQNRLDLEDDDDFLFIYDNIKQKINIYVGTISEDT